VIGDVFIVPNCTNNFKRLIDEPLLFVTNPAIGGEVFVFQPTPCKLRNLVDSSSPDRALASGSGESLWLGESLSVPPAGGEFIKSPLRSPEVSLGREQ